MHRLLLDGVMVIASSGTTMIESRWDGCMRAMAYMLRTTLRFVDALDVIHWSSPEQVNAPMRYRFRTSSATQASAVPCAPKLLS